MVRLLVFFLVALAVTNVTAIVLEAVSARAKGRAECRPGYGSFGPDPATVSIILRRYDSGNGTPKQPPEERVLDTYLVTKGEYYLSGTGLGNNFGTKVELFLRLTFKCNGLSGVKEVQIPDYFIARHPNIIHTIPYNTFQHDFDIYFDGP